MRIFGPSDRDQTCGLMVPNGPMKAISAKNSFSAPFRSENRALQHSYLHCFRVLRNGRWSVVWSTGISVESYARLASRIYSRGDRFLYGYYNSEQHLIQVKICTAVDKEKEPQKNYSYVRSWKQEEVDPKRIS